jgi:uncharacterized protein YuzE
MAFSQQMEYSERADALYVRLSDGEVARTEALGDLRMVDYDAAGQVVGIEFLGASHGLDLHDVPMHKDVERLVGNRFPVFA